MLLEQDRAKSASTRKAKRSGLYLALLASKIDREAPIRAFVGPLLPGEKGDGEIEIAGERISVIGNFGGDSHPRAYPSAIYAAEGTVEVPREIMTVWKMGSGHDGVPVEAPLFYEWARTVFPAAKRLPQKHFTYEVPRLHTGFGPPTSKHEPATNERSIAYTLAQANPARPVHAGHDTVAVGDTVIAMVDEYHRGEKCAFDGTVMHVNKEGVDILYLSGYRSRNDFVPFRDLLAKVDKSAPHVAVPDTYSDAIAFTGNFQLFSLRPEDKAKVAMEVHTHHLARRQKLLEASDKIASLPNPAPEVEKDSISERVMVHDKDGRIVEMRFEHPGI